MALLGDRTVVDFGYNDFGQLGDGTEVSSDAPVAVPGIAAVRAVTVTGNVKYDLPCPEPAAEVLHRRLGRVADRPVFVAGSTGPGEEDLVAEAFEAARGSHPDLLLLLAPRHPSRVDAVESLLVARGLRVGRYSPISFGITPEEKQDLYEFGRTQSLELLADAILCQADRLIGSGHPVETQQAVVS